MGSASSSKISFMCKRCQWHFGSAGEIQVVSLYCIHLLTVTGKDPRTDQRLFTNEDRRPPPA